MQARVDGSKRGERKAYTYSAAELGLTEEGIEKQSDSYRKACY